MLLSARSAAEASLAATLLSGELPERDVVRIANIREFISELPMPPFAVSGELSLLVRALSYEPTDTGARQAFDCDGGVFGIEFTGEGNAVERIILVTAEGKVEFKATGAEILDPAAVELLLHYEELADRLVEALQVLGVPITPRFYLNMADYVLDNAAQSAADLMELF